MECLGDEEEEEDEGILVALCAVDGVEKMCLAQSTRPLWGGGEKRRRRKRRKGAEGRCCAAPGDHIQILIAASALGHWLEDKSVWHVYFSINTDNVFPNSAQEGKPRELNPGPPRSEATILSSTTLYIRCATFATLGIRQSLQRVNKCSP